MDGSIYIYIYTGSDETCTHLRFAEETKRNNVECEKHPQKDKLSQQRLHQNYYKAKCHHIQTDTHSLHKLRYVARRTDCESYLANKNYW